MADAAAEQRRLGRQGEKLARKYLEKQGFRHLASNYAIPGGEIDLVMFRERLIVFAEVKTRQDESFIRTELVVNRTKQEHLARAARQFIKRFDLHDHPWRFDVVVVLLPPGGKPVIRHTPGYFTAK